MSPPTPVAALAVAALALLGACGSDSASPGATTTVSANAAPTTGAPSTTSAPTTATTEAPSDEEAILAAIEGFWQSALDAKSEPPNPGHPSLDRYLTGVQLERARQSVQNRLEVGQAVREASPSHYSIEATIDEVTGLSATATACAIDDLVVYDMRSGIIVNDAVQTLLITIELQLVEDIWKVAETASKGHWPGATQCE